VDLSIAQHFSAQDTLEENNADTPYVYVPNEIETVELEHLGHTVSQRSVIVSYGKWGAMR
jgi:hypothetical protein